MSEIFTGLALRTKVTEDAKLEIFLENVEVGAPADHEVIVRVEAAPINPSDLGLLVGPADPNTFAQAGTADDPKITAEIPAHLIGMLKARLGKALPCGNEGAGVVVAAGAAPEAQALMGKVVSVITGSTYSQYQKVPAAMALPHNEGTTPRDGASWFVNPLTCQAMVETMRAEGHKALIHAAAASNLGQMLNKVCIADGVDLVNIVRKDEQEKILKDLGAKYIVNSSKDSFMDDLTDAIAETGATIAFDPIGGGRLADDLLKAMEAAANRNASEYSRYGSDTWKQVYIYGGLDRGPTTLSRSYGLAWGVNGFLLTPFLAKAGEEVVNRLRTRVANEIKTTFASHYTKEVSLKEALSLEALAVYAKQATGEKYLINPSL